MFEKIKTGSLRIKLVVISIALFTFLETAYSDGILPVQSPLRAIVSVGGGGAFFSNIGQSRTFPIINPLTDEFYIYTANHSSQNTGLFDVFAGAEWQMLPNWALQFGVGYDLQGKVHTRGNFLQGADVGSENRYRYRFSVFTQQVFAESKLLYQFRDRFFPYFFWGLGAAFNEASNYRTTVPPFLTFTRQYQNNTQTSFAYTLGLGIDTAIDEHVRFGVGYRFADFGKLSLGQAIIDTTPVNGTLSQNNFYANEVLAQITWVI